MKITAGKGKVVSQESQRQADDHKYTSEIDRLRSQIYRQRQTGRNRRRTVTNIQAER